MTAEYLRIAVAVRGPFRLTYTFTVAVGGPFEIRVLTHYSCCCESL